jgi:hypothetical protein
MPRAILPLKHWLLMVVGPQGEVLIAHSAIAPLNKTQHKLIAFLYAMREASLGHTLCPLR